jgi:hypothetical protein
LNDRFGEALTLAWNCGHFANSFKKLGILPDWTAIAAANRHFCDGDQLDLNFLVLERFPSSKRQRDEPAGRR